MLGGADRSGITVTARETAPPPAGRTRYPGPGRTPRKITPPSEPGGRTATVAPPAVHQGHALPRARPVTYTCWTLPPGVSVVAADAVAATARHAASDRQQRRRNQAPRSRSRIPNICGGAPYSAGNSEIVR